MGNTRFQGKCFKCNKFAGHRARECPLNDNQPTAGGRQ
jgi:hypothetical protein